MAQSSDLDPTENLQYDLKITVHGFLSIASDCNWASLRFDLKEAKTFQSLDEQIW